MCFVWIWEQTAITSLYTDLHSYWKADKIGSLVATFRDNLSFHLERSSFTLGGAFNLSRNVDRLLLIFAAWHPRIAMNSLYVINWLLTRRNVYCAVRSDFLNVFQVTYSLCFQESESNVLSNFLRFPKENLFFWKAPRLCPFVLLVTATCSWRRVWSIGENPEVVGEILPQSHFTHNKFRTDWPGLEPDSPL